MRTRKQELVSDDLKPFVCNIMKEYREKYNYSLEDLARALNYKKNRQTLHKYETGTLNIPYEIFFDIANIFNINSDVFDEIPMTKDEKDLFEKKMIRSYVNTMTGNNNITSRGEKIVIIVVMILLLLLRVMFYLLEDYIKVVMLLFFRLWILSIKLLLLMSFQKI